MSSEKQVCPYCEHENEIDAVNCSRCHMPLALRTTIQFTGKTNLSLGMPSMDEGITLFVPGVTDPIIVGHKGELVLGRGLPGADGPDLDLTPYQAHTHGVSRRHAIISHDGEHYNLSDLGSTNGTQLNGRKLAPNETQHLNHGDQIQLARLTLFVYFGHRFVSTVDQVQAISLSLVDRAIEPGAVFNLTPRYLKQTLLPYLSALEGLQTSLDEGAAETPQPTAIQRVQVDTSRLAVVVEVGGITGAVEIVRKYVRPWRKYYDTALQKLWKVGHAVPETGNLDPLSTIVPNHKDAGPEQAANNEELEQTLQPLLKKLDDVYSTVDAEDLLPYLRTIAFSQLEMLSK